MVLANGGGSCSTGVSGDSGAVRSTSSTAPEAIAATSDGNTLGAASSAEVTS